MAIYVVGGLGDAGSIVRRQLDKLGLQYEVVDLKLGNRLEDYELSSDDYVIVATPPKAHIEAIEYCQEYGAKCFVEKPMLYRYDEVDRIDFEWAMTNLYVNFNAVFDMGVFYGVKAVKRFIKFPKPKYMVGGHRGIVLDIFPHLFSIVGDMIWKKKSVGFIYDKEGVDVYARAVYEKLDGSLIELEASYGDYDAGKKYVEDNDIILVILENGKVVRGGRLSEYSWYMSLRQFFAGERNFGKALYIQKLIEETYEPGGVEE